VADFFTLTKYTFQLVESRATYTIVVGNLRLLTFLIIYSTLTKYLLHKSKAGRHLESIIFNNMGQKPPITTSMFQTFLKLLNGISQIKSSQSYNVSFCMFLCIPMLLQNHVHILNKLWNIIEKIFHLCDIRVKPLLKI